MIKRSVLWSIESSNLESGCSEKKDLQQQDFVSAAVLLSPPRQRDGLPPAGQSEVHKDPSFCQFTPTRVEGLKPMHTSLLLFILAYSSHLTLWNPHKNPHRH